MTADASEMTPRDRRNQRRYALWMLGWFICLNATQALLRFGRGLVPPGVITWLVGALPVVVAAFVIWSWARYVREADELHRRIQLNALALGFGVTFFALASYGPLVSAGAPKLEANHYMAPGLCVYVLGLLYGKWQYR